MAKAPAILKSYAVAFAPDGHSLATAGRDVVMWDADGRTKRWRNHPFKHPAQLEFSNDSSVLAVKNTSGQIVILDAASGSTVSDFANTSDGEGGNVSFSDDDSCVVDCTWGGSHIVRHRNGGIVFREEFFPDMIKSSFRTTDGAYWFHHHRRQTAKSDRVAPERMIRRTWPFPSERSDVVDLPFPNRNCLSATLDRSGKSLIAILCHPDRRIVTYDFPSMALQREEILPNIGNAGVLRLSPDGKLLGTVYKDSAVLLELSSFKPVFEHPISYPCALAFTRDGKKLAIGSWECGTVMDLR